MNEPRIRIQNLSKVSLSIEAGSTADRFELTPQPVPHEIIFGIGAGGLSPFEFQIGGLSVGDELVMQVAGEGCRVFGPGQAPPVPLGAGGGDVFLRVRVTAVTRAGDREIVKAMAEMAACSDCGGDCCGHPH
jgi:hypothetical protein